MNIITTQTAKNYTDTDRQIAEVIQMWTQDFGATTAKLVKATELRNGRLAKSNSRYNLVLDGEPVEIDYIWIKTGETVVLIEQHNAE